MKPSEFLDDVGRPVAYYPKLRRIAGSTTANIMLCNLIYWRGKGANPDGWIYKTAEEIEDETGLSYREQQTARTKLISSGLMEEKYQRLDHRMFFRVDLGKLDEVWSSCFSETTNAQFPKRQMRSSGNYKSSDGETTDAQFDETTNAQFVINSIDYHSNTASTTTSTTTSKPPNGVVSPQEQIKVQWNKIAGECGLTPCRSIPSGRQKTINARLKETDWVENYQEALQKLHEIKWIRGNEKYRPRGIDWFIKPDTVAHILEGICDDSRRDFSCPSPDDSAGLF